MSRPSRRGWLAGPACSPHRPSTQRTFATGDAGFTLAEFLVAAAVFGIVALALGSGVASSISHDRQAGEQSRAVALAVDKMERLKARPAAELVSESPRRVEASGTEGSGPFTRWVDVTANGDFTKDVAVHVEFPTGGGQRRVTLRTVVYAPR